MILVSVDVADNSQGSYRIGFGDSTNILSHVNMWIRKSTYIISVWVKTQISAYICMEGLNA